MNCYVCARRFAACESNATGARGRTRTVRPRGCALYGVQTLPAQVIVTKTQLEKMSRDLLFFFAYRVSAHVTPQSTECSCK